MSIMAECEERERCAKIADEHAEIESSIFERTKNDPALSDNGRQAILDRALAREGLARLIAKRIRHSEHDRRGASI